MRKILVLSFVTISITIFSQTTKKLFETIKAGGKIDLELLKPKSTQAHKSNVIIQKIDSTYNWYYNINQSKWNVNPVGRTINYVYDANHNLLGYINQSYNSGSWYNSMKTENSYDGSNNLIQSVRSFSNSWSTGWQWGSKFDYTYNSGGKMLSNLKLTWNSVDWDSADRYTNTYDAQQNLTSEMFEKYISSSWQGDWRKSYTYDANNNMTSSANETYTNSAWEKIDKYINNFNALNAVISTTYQVGNGNLWENNVKWTYTLDASNNPLNSIVEVWTNNTWTLNGKTTYTCVGNNITALISQQWDGSIWTNAAKAIYTYNSANKELSRTYLNWSTALTNWVNSYRELRTFDANNNETSFAKHIWQANAWKRYDYSQRTQWDNNNIYYCQTTFNYDVSNIGAIYIGDSTVTYYKTVVGIKENNPKRNQILIYPNPGKGVFTIENTSHMTSISVFNLEGIQVFETKIESNNTKLDLSKLGAGMYFLMVNGGNSPRIHKVIIE